MVGNGGDGEFSVGASLPIDIYNQRQRRIDVANAEITLREAEVAARQRELADQIFANYAEALAALRELEATENLLELDLQTTNFVQIRVNEGETAAARTESFAGGSRTSALAPPACRRAASIRDHPTKNAAPDFRLKNRLRLREQIDYGDFAAACRRHSKRRSTSLCEPARTFS